MVFFEPLRGYRLVSDEVPEDDYTVPFGELRTIREGSDVTIVTWSASVPVVEEAVETLVAAGVDPHVVDLRTLVPLGRSRPGRGGGKELAAAWWYMKHRRFAVLAPKSLRCCKSRPFTRWRRQCAG